MEGKEYLLYLNLESQGNIQDNHMKHPHCSLKYK